VSFILNDDEFGSEEMQEKVHERRIGAAQAFVSLTLFFVGKFTLPLKEAPSQYLTNTRFQLQKSEARPKKILNHQYILSLNKLSFIKCLNSRQCGPHESAQKTYLYLFSIHIWLKICAPESFPY